MAVYQKLLRAESRQLRNTTQGCVCVWCTDVANSWDHLVPHWLLKRIWYKPTLMDRLTTVKVPACSTCNMRKGAMPPAAFAALPQGAGTGPGGIAKVKRNSVQYVRESREWNTIADYVAKHSWGELPDELIEAILLAMAEPVDLNVNEVGRLSVAAPPHLAIRSQKKRLKLAGDLPGPTLAELWPTTEGG